MSHPAPIPRNWLKRKLDWALGSSLWYFHAHFGCCGDEVTQSFGARYDLERFGCRKQTDPSRADLLLVSGALNKKGGALIQDIYTQMLDPKFVIAVGACACSGGGFEKENGIQGLSSWIPVDVFVPGCPPRPEAIMHGIFSLQQKITKVGVRWND